MNKRLPLKCPCCDNILQVKQLYCKNCHTEVTGLFPFPIISQLPVEDHKFILDFVKASGSLKIMARIMKLSYPTLRNLLDEIITRINNLDTDKKKKSV